MPQDDYIQLDRNGVLVSVVGEDASRLFRAKMLRGAIVMHQAAGIIPTAGMTLTKMFAIAKEYSGKSYNARKPGQHALAIADLDRWIAAMESAIPIKQDN